MSQLIDFFVFYILVPLIYIAILLFDLLLVLRSRTLENRWRNIAAVLVGFLVSIIVILLDQKFGPMIPRSVDDDYERAWTSPIIFGVIGFLVLLGIDLLLKRGAAFVILFTVVGVFLSGYFLLNMSGLRITTAVTTIGFLIGIILYFIVFPTRIYNTIRGRDAIE